jgi:FMN-dependent NADH-azoreductase
MHVLNIVASPRKEKSASAAIADAFLSEYKERAGNLLVDTLDIWQERFPSSTLKQSMPNTRASLVNR